MADSAIPILFFIFFLFVSLALILGLGLMSREDERAEEERLAQEGVGNREVGSGFMMARDTAPDSRAAVVNRLEPYTDAEERDSSQPAPGRTNAVEDLVAQLEDFLRGEAAAVAAFVAAPSIGGLLGDAASGHGLSRESETDDDSRRAS